MITEVLLSCGVWEPDETRFLVGLLRPGQTFVDVGAHVGYYSVLASKRVGPTGSVIAVEPDRLNRSLLRYNLERNDCKNVRIEPVACHSEPGWQSLVLFEENSGAHHLAPPGEGDVAVRCARLDDLVTEPVDVVKIDVQGHDHDVIESMPRITAANPGLVVLAELSRPELARRGIEARTVLDRYGELGFEVGLFDRDGRLQPMDPSTVLAVCEARRSADVTLVLRPRS